MFSRYIIRKLLELSTKALLYYHYVHVGVEQFTLSSISSIGNYEQGGVMPEMHQIEPLRICARLNVSKRDLEILEVKKNNKN